MRMFFLLTLMIFPISFARGADNIIDRIQQLEPGIVTIQTEYVKIISMPNKDKKIATYTRTGAGVIIDPKGIIVTNTHTIINAPIVWVLLSDGRKLPARVLSASLDYDFSLLKIDVDTPLTSIELADSNSSNISEPVIVVGNSEFNRNSLLASDIKTLLKNHSSGNVEFIEITLGLHRGDSGGPVFDRNGRLLGIVMAQHKKDMQRIVIIASNKIREQYWISKKKLP